MNTLDLENISKTIRDKVILKKITLHLESGNIYGFVGRNGSGKTMLFRMISGLIKPTEGMVKYNSNILGKDIDVIPRLGLIIENVGLYPEFTGTKNLKMLARINRIISDQEISDAITRVGLDPNDKRPIRKYSLGMKQRIVIAQAIMEKPDVLILDEPTNAIDENGVEQIRQIIREEKERGALILIASHSSEDIHSLCDMTYYMNAGECRLAEEEM